jgi:RHS repeat-associated protein
MFNDESGLYTVRYRTYSPTLGRWLERDPVGYVDGMGLYEYVRSVPISMADATGLACEVKVDCKLSGSVFQDNTWPAKNRLTCVYLCTESQPSLGAPTRVDSTRFSMISCADLGKGRLSWLRTRIVEARTGCPSCPPGWRDTITVLAADEMPLGTSCSKTTCYAACDSGVATKFLCQSLPPGAKEMCSVVVAAGTKSCKEICDAFCKKP